MASQAPVSLLTLRDSSPRQLAVCASSLRSVPSHIIRAGGNTTCMAQEHRLQEMPRAPTLGTSACADLDSDEEEMQVNHAYGQSMSQIEHVGGGGHV